LNKIRGISTPGGGIPLKNRLAGTENARNRKRK